MRKPCHIEIKNKKASFDFEFIERYTAGIVLSGTEVKAIREGKASLVDSYCYMHRDELWIKNMNVSEYRFGTYLNHDPRRERKLLLNRRELEKIARKVKEKGLTIVAIKMFFNENGLIKVDIAIAKGKKSYDKRDSIKEKDLQRDMQRRDYYV